MQRVTKHRFHPQARFASSLWFFIPCLAMGWTLSPAPVRAQVKADPSKIVPSNVGQESAKPASTLRSSFDFPLEPGDVLAVAVANHPEMNAEALVVNESGKIQLPVVGNITVAGQSMGAVQKLIVAAYRTQLRQPQVSVTMVRSQPRQVSLLGAVAKAGPLDLTRGWKVGDAIDAAGGLTAPIEDVVATLSRGKAKPQPLDLAQIVASPQNPANTALKRGDVIRINFLPARRITVTGDIKTPGVVTLRRRRRLNDALLGAGGLQQKPETTLITLFRAGKKLPLNATAALNNPKANVELQDGDLLNVEAIRTAVSVVSFQNLVKSPGSYTFPGQIGTLGALLAAGGLAVTPDQAVVSIRRGTTEIPVDIERAAYDPAADVPLKSGDILLVGLPGGPAVRVAGGIARPGELNLKKEATLLDAILTAGGLSAKPEETKISILRNSNASGRQAVLSVDPVALMGLGDLSQNVRLAEGDLVMVNSRTANTIFISGEVATPGAYQLRENEGLTELLLRAGGPRPTAALRQVRIMHRNNTMDMVDVSPARAGGVSQPEDVRASVPLQEGDLVDVPRNFNQVLVMNAVARPGYYPIPENGSLTIGDALLLAGPLSGARLQDVAILRRTATGVVDRRIIPVNQISQGKFTIDVPLSNGDVIYVPEGKTSQSKLGLAMTALSGVGLLRSVVGP